MPPNHKTITAAAMTTNKITSLRELLHCLPIACRCHVVGREGGATNNRKYSLDDLSLMKRFSCNENISL